MRCVGRRPDRGGQPRLLRTGGTDAVRGRRVHVGRRRLRPVAREDRPRSGLRTRDGSLAVRSARRPGHRCGSHRAWRVAHAPAARALRRAGSRERRRRREPPVSQRVVRSRVLVGGRSPHAAPAGDGERAGARHQARRDGHRDGLSSLLALQIWLFYGLLRGAPWRSATRLIAEYLESPGTQVYSIDQARQLFGELKNVTVRPIVTRYDVRVGRRRFLPRWVRRLVPPQLGWFLVIEGTR